MNDLNHTFFASEKRGAALVRRTRGTSAEMDVDSEVRKTRRAVAQFKPAIRSVRTRRAPRPPIGAVLALVACLRTFAEPPILPVPKFICFSDTRRPMSIASRS